MPKYFSNGVKPGAQNFIANLTNIINDYESSFLKTSLKLFLFFINNFHFLHKVLCCTSSCMLSQDWSWSYNLNVRGVKRRATLLLDIMSHLPVPLSKLSCTGSFLFHKFKVTQARRCVLFVSWTNLFGLSSLKCQLPQGKNEFLCR